MGESQVTKKAVTFLSPSQQMCQPEGGTTHAMMTCDLPFDDNLPTQEKGDLRNSAPQLCSCKIVPSAIFNFCSKMFFHSPTFSISFCDLLFIHSHFIINKNLSLITNLATFIETFFVIAKNISCTRPLAS